MKQFFGAFFGSVLGIIVATILAVVIIIGTIKSSIGGALKEERETSVVKANSILHIVMDGPIIDREVENPFADIKGLKEFSGSEGVGLNVLTKKIKAAASDNNIKGIYLDMKSVLSGYANITELRDVLLEFKKSGKFIYAYGEFLDQRSYYLASAANKVFVNPQGAVEFKGLSLNLMFYKQTLEKLGIEMQVFRHGKFKSAVEPFLLDKMSEANRLQTETFLNGIWSAMLDDISAERKVGVDDLNKWANELSIDDPESAIGKLIDAAAYEDEVVAELKKKIGVAEKDKLNFVEFDKYDPKHKGEVKDRNTQIAVIYAIGDISGGEGGNDEIGSDRISKAIRDARMNDKVKAIVLRVNSPGGSALASDVIWREMTLAKKAKPVIVSMGNFAASGGYYISCAAHRIFAEPNTITGSIGVFGIIPNLQKAFEQKLGITMDTVNTNIHSHIGSPFLPVNEKEREHIQKGVERVYDVFTKRVAEGRNMQQSEVDSIGQGRVWSGTDALKIKLVDELGGLEAAVAYAAKKANLKSYRLMEMPKQKHPLEELLGKKEDDMEARVIEKNLGPAYIYFKHIKTLLSAKGIQTRLPFEMEIN